MTRTLILALGACAMFTACNGDDDTDTDNGADTDTDTDTSEEVAPEITISGNTSEVFTQTAADSSHCVDAVDPQAALDGGELNILGTTVVEDDGSYSVSGVDVSQAPLAIFLILRDCDNSGDTVFPSATGFAAESYQSAEAGDELTSPIIYVSATTAIGLDQSLGAIGSTATMADGSVMAFVLDSQGAPVAGATVTCGDCGPSYYVDADARDGLLSTGTSANESTQAGVGLAFIPSGPVGAYQTTAEGMTYEPGLFGSLPGIAAFTAFQPSSN